MEQQLNQTIEDEDLPAYSKRETEEFFNSAVWEDIKEQVSGLIEDHLFEIKNPRMSIELIRYSQGVIEACEKFLELEEIVKEGATLKQMFEEERNNGYT